MRCGAAAPSGFTRPWRPYRTPLALPFSAGGRDPEVPGRAPFYILRPEAAESLFILHQLTGNPIYREWG